MLDLRELLSLLEDAETSILRTDVPVPDELDKAIDMLHTEIHKDG